MKGLFDTFKSLSYGEIKIMKWLQLKALYHLIILRGFFTLHYILIFCTAISIKCYNLCTLHYYYYYFLSITSCLNSFSSFFGT